MTRVDSNPHRLNKSSVANDSSEAGGVITRLATAPTACAKKEGARRRSPELAPASLRLLFPPVKTWGAVVVVGGGDAV